MHENQIVTATITGVHPYGLDIEAEGRVGFIQPIELGWTRSRVLSDFQVGDEVVVLVYAITPERFYASIKQASPQEDPWIDPSRFALGTRHVGVVTRVLAWGTEVEIASGVYAMILARDRRTSVEVGADVEVEVVDVDLPLRRLAVRQV